MIASLRGWIKVAAACAALLMVLAAPLMAQQPEVAGQPETAERAPGGEASLVLPALDSVDVGGYNGRTLLMIGLGVSLLGMVFGLVIMTQLKNLPVHRSMREISELIYETCKTYLVTAGQVPRAARDLHRRHHRAVFRGPVRAWTRCASSSSCSSASSASSAATAWPGSASA